MNSTGTTNTTGNAQGGDVVDKGINMLEQKSGHAQSASTTEKVSDGVKSAFTKVTGKSTGTDKDFAATQ